MPLIHRLETRLINQIAAGEVVVRPASAIKELLENSIDSGACRIEISVQEDTLNFSIRDDGCGMSREDLELCIERYATSKIRDLDDLMQLRTRGFRGEALAAISAVSRIEIMTRQHGDESGWVLRASGGHSPKIHSMGIPEGTTIAVSDLFYNTPVRLKFLKGSMPEWGHILQNVIRQALTRPDIAFSVRWRGRPFMDLPSDQSVSERFTQVFPEINREDVLEVALQLGEVKVNGIISHPKSTRRDRRRQYFFANQRPITYRTLAMSFEEAYRGLVMTQHYPMCALFIELPTQQLDANVHPTKEEVRFLNEAIVAGAVHRAAREALRRSELVPMFQPAPAPSKTSVKIPFVEATKDTKTGPDFQSLDFIDGFGMPGPKSDDSSVMETASCRNIQNDTASISILDSYPKAMSEKVRSEPDLMQQAQIDQDSTAKVDSGIIERVRRSYVNAHAVAQVDATYILATAGDAGILVLDQHAVHEKILYLKFINQMKTDALEIQTLLIPYTFEVAADEMPLMEMLIEPLQKSGFDLEPFGGRAFVIHALPILFEKLQVEGFIRDLLDDVGLGDLAKETQRLLERICARAACRAAVKSGDKLTLPEMQRLLEEALNTQDALRCPHGRPTLMLLTREQLDRQFGRLG